MTDTGWSVLPRGVQEAALAVGGGRDKGVEIGLLALEQKGSVVGRIDATRNAAVAQGIAALQEHLVGAVGGAHAVPDVLWAAGSGQFGHDVREVVPIHTVNHAHRRLVVAWIWMHGVDEEVAVVVHEHARDFRLRRQHHDARDRRRRLGIVALGGGHGKRAEDEQHPDGAQDQPPAFAHV